jgi:hypothetical protein
MSLEKIHRHLCASIMPLTMMIVRRRYSPSALEKLVSELEVARCELQLWLREKK